MYNYLLFDDEYVDADQHEEHVPMYSKGIVKDKVVAIIYTKEKLDLGHFHHISSLNLKKIDHVELL